jgi:hypothetical protein
VTAQLRRADRSRRRKAEAERLRRVLFLVEDKAARLAVHLDAIGKRAEAAVARHLVRDAEEAA